MLIGGGRHAVWITLCNFSISAAKSFLPERNVSNSGSRLIGGGRRGTGLPDADMDRVRYFPNSLSDISYIQGNQGFWKGVDETGAEAIWPRAAWLYFLWPLIGNTYNS
jgi:hypothetical protein